MSFSCAGNQVRDYSALGSLTDLEYLNLFHNRIEDVSALERLARLDYLELGLNERLCVVLCRSTTALRTGRS
ncbi:MAG: leucine-rich repeat domain-containing protein [Acetatifactor sp.]|nr:leucine-rich repeat domain-containing protein [Acetatifactor sp.]